MRETTMHDDTTIEDVYARFARIWGNGLPLINRRALSAAISALGLGLGDVTDEWLRSLDDDWVHGRSDYPFHDDGLNRRYRHLIVG